MIVTPKLGEWLERQQVVAFLQEAVQCDTVNPPGNELGLAQKIHAKLKSHGVESILYPTGDGRANLVARLKGKHPGKRLVFSGHLDTVPIGDTPWKYPPFSGGIAGGRLYGRGATDMKSGLLALMYAFLYFRQEVDTWSGELVFAATFGEETGGDGAHVMVEENQLPPFDAMIIGEPTENRIVTAHKGVLWVEVESRGKTAHASMPQTGVNAIENLLLFYSRLSEISFTQSASPLLSAPTMTVTTFHGGKKTNVIPDSATMTIDIRTVPGQNHQQILAGLSQLAEDVMRTKTSADIIVRPLINLLPVVTDAQAEIVGIAKTVLGERNRSDTGIRGANYFTDGSVFTRLGGADILIIGPGKPELAHQTNEYVEVDAYVEAIEIYFEVARRYLQTTDTIE